MSTSPVQEVDYHFESGARGTAASFGKHSSRMPGDVYTILNDFAEYHPDFEAKRFRSKRPSSFPTKSFAEPQSALFDTFFNEGSGGGDASRALGNPVINASRH